MPSTASTPAAPATPHAPPTPPPCTRVADIPPAEWDSLAASGGRLAEHWFARACEAARIEGSELRCLAARDGGRLAGIATFFRMDVSVDLLAGPGFRDLVARLRRVSPGLLRLPVAFGGLPVSFGESMLLWREDSAPGVVRTAVETLERLGAEWRTPLLCLKEFRDDQAAVLDERLTDGWLKLPSLPGCRLPIRWHSTVDYLADMRAGYRRQWRAAAAKARDAGVAVHPLPGEVCDPARLHHLYRQVMERAPHRLECLNLEFFEQLLATGGPDIRVWEARGGDRLLGMALVLTSPRRWQFLLAGLEGDAARQAGVYGALVQRLTAEAIEAGAAELELGQTSYALKGRLGGEISPRWIYLKARSPLLQPVLAAAGPHLFPATPVVARRVFHRFS